MVTLAEVAQHAGVSASTVSYVLSGKRSISATTRQRVEQSIRELGYHPNAGARALAGKRSNIIALMIPLRTDMYVPVMMEIAIAVATTARTHGYDVLLLTGEEGPDAVRRVTGSGLADAMILMDVELEDERLPLLRETDQPSVLIGLPADSTGLTCVDLDWSATGALCVEHLAGLGHRDIAVIGEAPAVYERHTGFAERTLDGLRARPAGRASECCTGRARGGYDALAPHPGPDLRRAPGDDRVRRAERVGGGAAARAAAPAGPGRAGGRVRGRDLPRPGGGPGVGAADVGRHPGPGDGPARRGAPGGQAGRAGRRRGRAARPRADGTGEFGTGADRVLNPPLSRGEEGPAPCGSRPSRLSRR